MTSFPILAVEGLFMDLIAVLFIISCVLLILIILIQKGKGGGLSSAFGGGMASGILGSKTGDFLTWVTIVFVGIMLTLAVVLAKYYKPAPTAIPGASAAAQSQQPPAAPSQEAAPEPNNIGQTNNNNSPALPSAPSVTQETVPSPESTGQAGESTNPNGDTNQPGS
jgi:preprotein translocase subunit SecG